MLFGPQAPVSTMFPRCPRCCRNMGLGVGEGTQGTTLGFVNDSADVAKGPSR